MGQFAVPLAILGIGLIGEWLIGPKKSTTAAPDSMPMLNSALRGQIIPVTFGANRVAAQVVWTKNFTAIRQQSSGKGGAKGGGSGGFGSAKGGGAAGVGYLYYWDFIFNFGIVDRPSIIGQGWVGADPMDSETLDALTGGLNSAIFVPKGDQSAHLTFTESFMAAGYPTGDLHLESWAYFEDQMGFDCQWPNTFWLGFNQLELGQTPSVPQISLELVPNTATFVPANSAYANPISNDQIAQSPGTQPYMKDESGALWSFNYHDESSDLFVHRIVDGHEIVTSEAQIKADFATCSGQTYFGSLRFPTAVIPVPGTPYLYITWCDIHFPHDSDAIYAILYQITDEDTLTLMGSHRMWYGDGIGLTNNYPTEGAAVVLNNGEIMCLSGGRSTNFKSYFVTLPAPADVAGGNTDSGSGAHEMEGRTHLITEVGDDFFRGNSFGRGMAVGIAPSGTAGAKFYIYIPKGRCQYELANTQNAYIQSAAGTYPDGFMMTIQFPGAIGDYDLAINNAFFRTTEPVAVVPFADAQLDSTGAAGTSWDDWGSIAVTSDGSIVMLRSYSDAPYKAKVLVFDSTGLLVTTASFDFSTVDIFGTEEHRQTDLYLDSGGAVWFMADREGTLNQNRWHVQLGTFNSFQADITPPYIVRRVLTSPIWGFQTQALFGFTVTDDSIDDASYNAAVAYCEAQGIKVSVTYTNQDNLLTILNELVQIYGGFLTEDGGTIFFNTVTAQDEPVRTIDNSRLVPPSKGTPPVTVTKAALEDGYNKIQWNYLDRDISYKQNQVEAADEVDVDINGPRVKTYQARYVMAGSLAQMVATRALWSNLYGKDQYAFQLGWKDADLRPGKVITLVDSFDPTLSQGVRARITGRQEQTRGHFQIQATREIPYIITTSVPSFTSQSSVDPGYDSLVDAAAAPDFQTAYELPREFQGAQAQVYFGYNQKATCMGAQLYISLDGGNYVLSQDTQPYVVSGRFRRELEQRPKGYCETDVEFWIFPTPEFDPTTPTFFQNYTQDDVTQAIRAAGGGVMIVGSEAVSMENLTLLGQNHYRAKRLFRGWGGSPISSHTSGAYWHHQAAGIFNHEITLDDIGTTLSYKIAPYNFAGRVYDISSIDARTYTIKGDYWLPREQPRTKFYVDSAVAWPASTPLTGPYLAVTSGGCNLNMGWSQAANDEGYGAGGYGAGNFGHFIASDSVNYRVDIASKNAVKVSSFVVTTGFFSYTLEQNSADFTGFGHDLVVTVTPFTIKGDGPVNDVNSISLNW